MTYGTVQISHLTGDAEAKNVSFEVGQATVQDLLDQGGFDVESNESVKDSNSNPVALDSQAVDGARYFIAANVKAGNF